MFAKTFHRSIPAALLLLLSISSYAEPQLASWYTEKSGAYARIFTSTASEAAGTDVTTWSRGQGVQTLPVYAGVHEINFSNDWIPLVIPVPPRRIQPPNPRARSAQLNHLRQPGLRRCTKRVIGPG